MLQNMFDWILLASWGAAAVGVLLLLLKRLLRGRLSPGWQYALWLILLCKLLLPIGPASTLSLYNAVPQTVLESAGALPVPLEQSTAPAVTEAGQKPQMSEAEKETPSFSGHQLAAVIWLSGASLLLLFWGGQYGRLGWLLRREGRKAPEDVQTLLAHCQREVGIRQPVTLVLQPFFASPAVTGLFQKRLLLPWGAQTLNPQELRYVFLHELYHLRHRDLWINALLLIFQALHWFNPVLWYCFASVRRDMELACDASVLRHLTEGEGLAYGQALLKAAAQKKVPYSARLLTMASDYDSLRERILQIKKAPFWQKHRRSIALTGSLCLLVMALLLLTGPEKNKQGLIQRFWAQTQLQSGEAPTLAEALWDSKTPYVGSPSAIGKIQDQLPFGQHITKTALQTGQEPYGIILQLSFPAEQTPTEVNSEQFYRNAAMLLALVDNLGYVEYQITTADITTSWKGQINRADAAAAYARGDLRDVTSDQETFALWVDDWAQADIAEAAQNAFWSEQPARDVLPPALDANDTVRVSAEGEISNPSAYEEYLTGQRPDLLVLVYSGQTLAQWQYYTRDDSGGLICVRYLPNDQSVFAGTYDEQPAQPFTPLPIEEWAQQLTAL